MLRDGGNHVDERELVNPIGEAGGLQFDILQGIDIDWQRACVFKEAREVIVAMFFHVVLNKMRLG